MSCSLGGVHTCTYKRLQEREIGQQVQETRLTADLPSVGTGGTFQLANNSSVPCQHLRMQSHCKLVSTQPLWSLWVRTGIKDAIRPF
jgi:hypothetical protein